MAPIPVPSCGGQRAACIYTITGTCRMNGIDPQAYLTMSLQRSLIIPLTRSTLCFIAVGIAKLAGAGAGRWPGEADSIPNSPPITGTGFRLRSSAMPCGCITSSA